MACWRVFGQVEVAMPEVWPKGLHVSSKLLPLVAVRPDRRSGARDGRASQTSRIRGLRLRASDQNAGCEDQGPAENDLKRGAPERRLHVPVLHPGNCPEFH